MDKDGRTWGSFEVIRETNGNIHGYLKATDEFKEIQHIFLEHSEGLPDPDSDPDKTISEILQLGAYLIDNQSGNRANINNIIFVNEDFLVTCEIY